MSKLDELITACSDARHAVYQSECTVSDLSEQMYKEACNKLSKYIGKYYKVEFPDFNTGELDYTQYYKIIGVQHFDTKNGDSNDFYGDTGDPYDMDAVVFYVYQDNDPHYRHEKTENLLPTVSYFYYLRQIGSDTNVKEISEEEYNAALIECVKHVKSYNYGALRFSYDDD